MRESEIPDPVGLIETESDPVHRKALQQTGELFFRDRFLGQQFRTEFHTSLPERGGIAVMGTFDAGGFQEQN